MAADHIHTFYRDPATGLTNAADIHRKMRQMGFDYTLKRVDYAAMANPR